MVVFGVLIAIYLVYLGFSPVRIEETPNSHEIKWDSYFAQPNNITCGPTSVAMVLDRYGRKVTIEEVATQSKTKWFTHQGESVGMTVPEYAVRSMKIFGIPCRLTRGSIGLLKFHVSHNRPIICLLRSGLTTWHYVVVIGFTKEKIVIANPSGGIREELPVENFESSWSFSTDMDGEKVIKKCPRCDHGKVRWLGIPLDCDLCGGSGNEPDYLRSLLSSADVWPNTMIVPRIDIRN